MICGGIFDLDNKIKRKEELDKIINDVNFWNSDNKENDLREFSELENIIKDVKRAKNKIQINIQFLNEEIDDDIFNLINEEKDELSKFISKLRVDTYLSGEFDKNDCFLEIHSGAGGTEACDWANMLYRMYTRYLTKNNYKYVLLDKQDGEEVGIKSVMIEIRGKNAYGYLKGEIGVHRLVRISPFDANKRRHTSFASVLVTPKIDKSINIVINDSDIRVDIYRSSGPGGQGVNTTDSAVRITHLATGIVVTCQNERSQIQNKEVAMEVLRNKLYNLELAKKNDKLNEIKGEQMTIGFGSAKRSYVMCPYTLVRDNDSGYESSNVTAILDGELGELIEKNIRR